MQYFSHSKKDIRSLTVFYTICSIFAVVPCHSFDKSNKIKTKWKKFQGTFLLITIAAGTAYSMYRRHTFYKDLYTTTHMVLDYIDEFFVVMLAFTVIFNSCFCERECWIKLNSNLRYIDEILNNTDIKEKNILRNTSVQFVLYLTLYVSASVFLMLTWTKEMGVITIEAYAMHQFCYIYDVLAHFLIYAITSGLKSRYDDLNALLENNGSDYSEKKVIIYLRKVGNISQCMSETVDLFNAIFGVPLIFITGKGIAQLLTCLNFLTNNLKFGDAYFKQRILIANLSLLIFTLVSISFVMMSSDAATISSRKTVSLCYRLQEQFVTKSEARSEMFKLAQQTAANAAVITAANYFQINKATLFGIFGTTTTYFIIILQFNQSLSGK